MFKRIWLTAALVSIGFISTAYAIQEVNVLVLPFQINAQKDLGYLSADIPKVLKKHLAADGALIVEPAAIPDDLWKTAGFKIDEIRDFGRDADADFVIWGSMTWIGQQYSLDTRLLNLALVGGPESFYVAGEKIENLPKTTQQLARDLGARIFKREKVARVDVRGNQRIEVDAIKRHIRTAPGDVFLAKSLSDDLKAVYAMGYFDDIRIEAEDSAEGKIIVFKVKEKPTIRNIIITGNDEFDDDEILETLDLRTGSVLNDAKIQNSISQIKQIYTEKNYHNAEVSYKIIDQPENQGDLEFTIVEGKELSVEVIEFDGNSAFTSKKLRGLMKTAEKGIFSWFTDSGELNREDLEQDMAKISAFYQNRGFIQIKVGDPQIEYKEDHIVITIKIDEGPQYRVGKVELSGDEIRPKPVLMAKLKLQKEEFFNREVMRNDILALTDICSDEGYAYADIRPKIDQDAQNRVVNIDYFIDKGKQVFFEKIIINGNTKTRDKVIRRELKVYEQEIFSGRRLKRGIQNLHRLDFFEDIKVDTVKGSADDKMILKIDVTEKSTGTFSLGGGYSSVENVFVSGSVQQRNLFGRGQLLNFKAELGGRTDRFTLSFTEPWLFDKPLSAGIDLFHWERDYDTYDKKSTGGSLRVGYRLRDFTRAFISYTYSLDNVDNIDESAAESIKELEGENVTSALSGILRYDSRDRIFNPTSGQDHSLTVKYAGLGGDINFIKGLGEAGIYYPLFWGVVGFARGEGGLVEETQGGLLPDYERFYLGGPNSMRGYDWRGVFALDEDGNEIGGNKYVLFNIEAIFPLYKDAGIMGVAFYDTGNVWAESDAVDLGNLRQDAGLGVRWYSPMGPIRLEYGYILNPKEGEDSGGRWNFSMGAAF